MSAIGTPCVRRLWYSVNKPEAGEGIPDDLALRFMYGNLVEKLILDAVKDAGYTVELEQYEVEINGVKGHIDCLINGCLVDIKSASSSSFPKFVYPKLLTDDPFGYLDQINAYHWALRNEQNSKLIDLDNVYFLAMNKSSGALKLATYPIKQIDYSKKIDGLKNKMVLEEPPCRAFELVDVFRSGHKKLPVDCVFCPFKKACYPNLQQISDYNYVVESDTF